MSITKKEFSDYVRSFHFRELFNDLGWNNDKTIQPISVDTVTFQLNGVAEKSGFKILLCNHTTDGHIPDYNIRKKIETKVTKLFQEHLIIFPDPKRQEQVWQLVVRQPGKPTKVTETSWHINQDPELLYQRASGLFFELDEEEHITIIDVTKRVADNSRQLQRRRRSHTRCNRRWRGRWCGVVVVEIAAGRHLHAEQREEIRGRDAALDLHGIGFVARERRRESNDARDAVE